MKYLIKIIIALLSLTIIVGFTSCNKDDDLSEQPVPNPSPGNNPVPPVTANKIRITIGSTVFTATLQGNETATAFRELLPMTINMSELNNNEKYYSLPQALPVNASNPGTIKNGDLMLYGTSTLVLFYKTFSTSYSYTRIGSIDNASALETALGSGSVTVTFEIE